MVRAASIEPALWHEALFYRSDEEYLAGTVPFVEAARACAEPLLVMVPPDRAELLRAAVDGRDHHHEGQLRFVDMTGIGRNPARIIPAQAQFFAEQRRPARVIGEPAWCGRDSDELAECFWHEALINLAFARTPARILCPYDVRGLATQVIRDAWRSHPVVTEQVGASTASTVYRDPADAPQPPLPAPPVDAEVLSGGSQHLDTLRDVLRRRGRAAGLSAERTDDLILAASEAATNSIRYSARPAVIRIWHEPGAVVCEVADAGHVADLLAGRRAPGAELEGQRGLWLINQVCDLVQLRSGRSGTTIRMHIRTS